MSLFENMNGLLSLVKKYSDKYINQLKQNEKDLLSEFIDKLTHIDELNTKINQLNQDCLNYSLSSFDPDTDTYSIGGISIKLQRKDLNKRIIMTPIATGYTKGNENDSFFSQDLRKMQRELERLTNNFYEYAHRIIKICENLPELKGFKCKEITLVRNKLIAHPEKESGVVLDSFAYSRQDGPIIKGTRYSNQANIFPSKGYNNDYLAFINKLTEKLRLSLKVNRF